jgi:hypothetical protein
MGSFVSFEEIQIASSPKKITKTKPTTIQPSTRNKPYDIFERPSYLMDIIYEENPQNQENQENQSPNESNVMIYHQNELKHIQEISKTNFYHIKKNKASPMIVINKPNTLRN